jgi:hypothetical protein
MNPKRPQTDGSYTTTPMAAAMMTLLGAGMKSGGVTFSRSETKALAKLYGFKPEAPRQRPPKPEPPHPGPLNFREENDYKAALKTWKDPREFFQAGANRDLLRHAEHDGLRLIAWLAKYVHEGSDPLKTLIQLAVDAGWDVDPTDVAFAGDDLDSEDAVLEDEEPDEEPPSTPRHKVRGAGRPSGAGA